jgi:hypothetical protein
MRSGPVAKAVLQLHEDGSLNPAGFPKKEGEGRSPPQKGSTVHYLTVKVSRVGTLFPRNLFLPVSARTAAQAISSLLLVSAESLTHSYRKRIILCGRELHR